MKPRRGYYTAGDGLLVGVLLAWMMISVGPWYVGIIALLVCTLVNVASYDRKDEK